MKILTKRISSFQAKDNHYTAQYKKWCNEHFTSQLFFSSTTNDQLIIAQEKHLEKLINKYHKKAFSYNIVIYLLFFIMGGIFLFHIMHWVINGSFLDFQSNDWSNFLAIIYAIPLLIGYAVFLVWHGKFHIPTRFRTIRIIETCLKRANQPASYPPFRENLIFSALEAMERGGGFRKMLVKEANSLIDQFKDSVPKAILRNVRKRWFTNPIVLSTLAVLVVLNTLLFTYGDSISSSLDEILTPVNTDTPDQTSQLKTTLPNGQDSQVNFGRIQIPPPSDKNPSHKWTAGTQAGKDHQGGKAAAKPDKSIAHSTGSATQQKSNLPLNNPSKPIIPKWDTSSQRGEGVRGGGTVLPRDYSVYME
jgi:hypothetical protein